MVGALRQPDLAGRHRDRAAAGRAATGERGVPGIARTAEHLVEGASARAELRRVGLAHHDAALALDAFDQRMRSRGHMVGEDRRAVGGAHARHVVEVLDRHRQSAEPAGFAGGRAGGATRHDLPGMIARAIETEGRHRVHGGFDLGDTVGGDFDQLERRDLLLLQPRHRLHCRHLPEIAHGTLPRSANHLCRTCCFCI